MYLCTPLKPWRPEYGTPVQHANAREEGEQRDGYPGGDIQSMHCPDCGHRWTIELPQ